jgi:nitrite reductase (NADH) large subunit
MPGVVSLGVTMITAARRREACADRTLPTQDSAAAVASSQLAESAHRTDDIPSRVEAAPDAFGDASEPGAARPAATADPVVIVGGGPAGIRAAQELSRRGVDCVVFNAERWQPYNRVKLTPLLCGDAQLGQIMQRLEFPGPGVVRLYSEQSVIDIDRVAHTVTTRVGRTFAYRKLVLAVGSRAHVPPIPNRELSGVFTLRNIDDVEHLVARSFSSRRTVVICGGLLGLEAARGMARRGTETWVVEHSPHLMPRQLDSAAAGLLAEQLRKSGLVTRTGSSIAGIVGTDRVEAIELSGGERVPCDTVIICTGVRANMELARDVGLAVGRGIRVSERLLTSDPDIYAIGECAEFNGVTAGLVGPGFEQAVVAAGDIAGTMGRYAGSVPSTKLKVGGIDVFSMGDVEQIEQRSDITPIGFRDDANGIYRVLVFSGARLVGALGIGDWPEVTNLQEAIRSKALVLPWHRLRFRSTGRLWPEQDQASVHNWPRQATVCNCTGATRGQISDAIALGAATVEDVQRDTGASTVCGSCQVHVTALLGGPPVRNPLRWWRPVAAASTAAALGALLTLVLPVWPLARSIANIGLADKLWLDGTWKQVSGFTLLALSVMAALLSFRKRWLPAAIVRRIGEFGAWRLVHILIGTTALLVLFAHTGFRLGHNLNFWLMSCFLASSVSGATIGLTSALEHRISSSPATAARLRSLALWLHVLALWPLPLLLGFHILSVYYY